MFCVEDANHLIPVNDECLRWRNRDSRPHSLGLTCQAPLTEKITRSEDRHDRLFARLIDDAELYTPLLNVRGVACVFLLRTS